MARRQGLMFQNVPDQLQRVQVSNLNAIRGASLYGKGSKTKTKGPKEGGLSKVAKGLSLAQSGYSLYDKMFPASEAIKDAIPGAAKVGSGISEAAVSGVDKIAGDLAFEGAKGALATDTVGSLTAGGAAATTGAETMAAASEAWGGAAASANAVESGIGYLWALLL